MNFAPTTEHRALVPFNKCIINTKRAHAHICNRIRGRLASLLMLCVCTGILIGFSTVPYLSYYLVPKVFAPLPILFFVAFIFLPETPQYFISRLDFDVSEAGGVDTEQFGRIENPFTLSRFFPRHRKRYNRWYFIGIADAKVQWIARASMQNIMKFCSHSTKPTRSIESIARTFSRIFVRSHYASFSISAHFSLLFTLILHLMSFARLLSSNTS